MCRMWLVTWLKIFFSVIHKIHIFSSIKYNAWWPRYWWPIKPFLVSMFSFVNKTNYDFKLAYNSSTTRRNFISCDSITQIQLYDNIIKWNHFPRYWPFVWGIQQFPAKFLHKDQWRRALMFSLICPGINDWANNREAGDLRRHRPHYQDWLIDPFIVVSSDLFVNHKISQSIQ